MTAIAQGSLRLRQQMVCHSGLSGLRLIESLSDGTQEEFSSGRDPEPSSG